MQTPPGGSTGSDSALQQAIEWLRKCVQEHKGCNCRADRGSWNPTRLIDVGNAGDSLVRLIPHMHSVETVRYLTLSHCWGQAQFIRLSAHSAQKLQAGIAISALPKTFRDAIEVTRFLTIRYLWIDSLCIFQDAADLSDWTKEASLMDKVYAHGTLNISATAASDSLQGLFFDRRSSDFHTQAVDFAFDEEGMRCSNIAPCYTVKSLFWIDCIEDAPVNKRAWVLQERLLAKRVLHFGQTQLFWECAELEAAETFPNGLPKIVRTSKSKFKDVRRIVTDYDDPEEHVGKILDWYGKWNDIVRQYTSARLSNSQDKLVAITGLAKEMNKRIRDEYVAGMWRGHLAGQLLWMRSYVAPPELRSHGYRAPSWSWASGDVEVFYPIWANFGIRFEVNDVSLEHKSRDTFGLLAGGYIILTGVLKRVSLLRSLIEDEITMNINGRSVASDLLGVDLDYQIPDKELVSANEAGSFFGLEAHSSNDFVVLLLLRVEDREGGVFSRIGMAASVREPEVFRRMLERDEDEPNLPSMHWNVQDRTHNIRVI